MKPESFVTVNHAFLVRTQARELFKRLATPSFGNMGVGKSQRARDHAEDWVDSANKREMRLTHSDGG